MSSVRNQNLVATIGGSADGSGNPVIEPQPYTGAAGQLWQLNQLGLVYLHGWLLTCG